MCMLVYVVNPLCTVTELGTLSRRTIRTENGINTFTYLSFPDELFTGRKGSTYFSWRNSVYLMSSDNRNDLTALPSSPSTLRRVDWFTWTVAGAVPILHPIRCIQAYPSPTEVFQWNSHYDSSVRRDANVVFAQSYGSPCRTRKTCRFHFFFLCVLTAETSGSWIAPEVSPGMKVVESVFTLHNSDLMEHVSRCWQVGISVDHWAISQ